jgi:hypothetical protein
MNSQRLWILIGHDERCETVTKHFGFVHFPQGAGWVRSSAASTRTSPVNPATSRGTIANSLSSGASR